MNKYDIENAINGISEERILASAPKKRPARTWKVLASAAAAAAVIMGAVWAIGAIKGGEKPHTEAQATQPAVQEGTELPEKTEQASPAPTLFLPTEDPNATPLPAKELTETGEKLQASALSMAMLPRLPEEGTAEYGAYMAELRRTKYGRGAQLGGFYARTINEFLGGSEENSAYSPFSVYTALAMLAETTAGNTRQQILDLLDVPDIETLRLITAGLVDSNYRDGEKEKILSAASFWMNDLFPASAYHGDTLDNLVKYYRASSFIGTMGSPEYDALMQAWINENTNDLLKDQVGKITSDPSTLLRLITTLYFKAGWSNGKQLTQEMVFHGANGDTSVDFLDGQGLNYYEGEGYTMASKGLVGGNKMWFILPDEGVSIDSLLESGEALEVIFTGNRGAGFEGDYKVHLQAPLFDSESKLNLIDGLVRLGVTDCFDPYASDFSPLTDLDQIFVGKADHGVRIIMNEEGVEAAAYTLIEVACGAAPIQKRIIEFTADRPFIYLIMSDDNTPLFAGTLYNAD